MSMEYRTVADPYPKKADNSYREEVPTGESMTDPSCDMPIEESMARLLRGEGLGLKQQMFDVEIPEDATDEEIEMALEQTSVVNEPNLDFVDVSQRALALKNKMNEQEQLRQKAFKEKREKERQAEIDRIKAEAVAEHLKNLVK